MAETETQVPLLESVRSPTHAVATHDPRLKAKSVQISTSPCMSSHTSDSESSSGTKEPLPFSRKPPRVHEQPVCCYIPYPSNVPVPVSISTTIQRVPEPLRTLRPCYAAPIAVAIGPYHHGSSYLQEMEEAKKVARDEFCQTAGQTPEVIQGNINFLTAYARGCYGGGYMRCLDDDRFAEIMFIDGCFLLQFMKCMCPNNRDDTPAMDGLWSKVHTRVDTIVRDIMLLENQLPWLVLKTLNEFTPTKSWHSVGSFLDLMANAFDVGNDATTQQLDDIDSQPPPHLLGLFYRRQVGAARTQSLRVPRLSYMSSTAVELAEMGVKITSTKARVFGDMTMTKRRHRLRLFGELALAPVVLNDLTACWLFNMLAHEACLGAACADNFAVSSYISAMALLVNRREDVQELRRKGVVVSEFCDDGTLGFFKAHALYVRVGYRYYDVFERLQEYRKERWVWIAVHSFLYRNLKTIIAVLSVAGVLAGLFKTILSIKQPQRG